MIQNFSDLLETAKRTSPKSIAVVYPDNKETFAAIAETHHLFRSRFFLFGDEERITEGLTQEHLRTVGAFEIIHANDPNRALRTALDRVVQGGVDILMKGAIDTGTFMKGVLEPGSGLRMDRLLSDIFVMEYPNRSGNKLIMITDGGMTLSPDLENKVQLIRNAVEVAHALGNENPKVAILSATEFVIPKLESTIDAAALSKMNQRGQIKGCIVDGPLALDNAISPEAAAEKNIQSPVAGKAEILVAANIESANSLAKSTTYFANLRLAHVIVGGRIPILIPSRADTRDAKLLSMALGMIVRDMRD